MQAHFYAQVNAGGIVLGVTQVAAEINAPDLVPIESLDTALIGQRWNPQTQAFEPGPLDTSDMAWLGAEAGQLRLEMTDLHGRACYHQRPAYAVLCLCQQALSQGK